MDHLNLDKKQSIIYTFSLVKKEFALKVFAIFFDIFVSVNLDIAHLKCFVYTKEFILAKYFHFLLI